MIEHVIKALSGLSASNPSQLKSELAGTRRRKGSAKGVVCALAAMVMAIIAAPQVYAQVYPSQQQIAVTGTATPVPTGVAVDASGNIYVADATNSVIDEINPVTHVVTTLGVAGLSDPQGLVLDTLGNLWISDYLNQRIVEWNLAGQTQAAFPLPSINSASGDIIYLAVDSSNDVFGVVNGGCANYCSVVEVPFGTTPGNLATTVIPWSGAGGLQLYGSDVPSGIAFDSSNNMYIADAGNGNVTEFYLAGNYPTGTATTFIPTINSPYQIGFDASQNFIVAANGDGAVYEYTQASTYATRVLLNLPNAYQSSFYSFAINGAIGAQNGELYIPDNTGSPAVTEDDNANAESFGPVTGSGPSAAQAITFTAPPAGYTLGTPAYRVVTQGSTTLDFQAAGNTCVPGALGSGLTCQVSVTFSPQAPGLRLGAVELLDNSTPQKIVATIYLNGVGVGPLAVEYPGSQSNLMTGLTKSLSLEGGVTADASGNLYVADTANSRVVIGLKANLPSCTSCTVISAGLSLPEKVAVDGAGNLYIADEGEHAVFQELLQTDGTYVPGVSVASNLVETHAKDPVGLAVDGAGNVYIGDISTNRNIIEAPACDLTCSLADCTTNIASGAPSGVNRPEGIAIDAGGNLYIADAFHARVLRVPSTDLTCSTPSDCISVASNITVPLDLPYGVALDPAGNVYIADFGNSDVVKVLASDLTCATNSAADCTLVGSGFNTPSDVALDGAGNIYIADTGDSAVEEINVSTPAQLTFPTTTTIPNVDTADGELSVTLTNIGNEALTYNSSPVNNPSYSSGFNYDPAGSCADSGPASALAINASCAYGVDFQPQGPLGGLYSGSILLSDNGDGTGQQTLATLTGTSNTNVIITLQATGQPGSVSISGLAGLTGGGSQVIGSSDTLGENSTIDDPGSGPGSTQYTFSSWNTPGSANPFTVPDQPATYTATYNASAYWVNPTVGGSAACSASTVGGNGYVTIPLGTSNITATPVTNCYFNGWTSVTGMTLDTYTSGPGTITTSTAQIATLTGPASAVADFEQITYTMNISSSNPNLTITTSGTGLLSAPVGGTANSESNSVVQGTTFTFSTTSPQYFPDAGTRYTFNNWTGTSTYATNSNPITVSGAITETANYNVAYQLTVGVDPGSDAVCLSSSTGGGGYFAAGATPTISVTPNSTCALVSWSGAAVASTSDTTTLTSMPASPTTVLALLQVPPVYVITVTTNQGGLTVSTSGTGLLGAFSNGPATSITDTVLATLPTPPPFTVSTTSPVANAGTLYTLINWTGAGNPTEVGTNPTFTPAASGTYTANFSVTGYNLIFVTPLSGQLCYGSTASATSPNAGLPSYYSGTVSITASPAPGCYFTGWSPGPTYGSSIGTEINSFTISGVTTLTPGFAPIPYYVVTTIADDPAGDGSPEPGNAANCHAYIPTVLPAVGFPPVPVPADNDGSCSLRDAVTAAEGNNGGAGFISWSQYAGPSLAQIPSNLLTGTTFLESALPAISGSITITGPGASVIDVDGDYTYPVFTIVNTAPNGTPDIEGIPVANLETISGLTISDGIGTNGGGITYSGGTPSLPENVKLSNLAFYRNAATTDGGAIAGNGYATVAVSNSSFDSDSAGSFGGAIFNGANSSMTVTNVSFTNDTATTSGGGIYNNGTGLTVNDSTFNGETATNTGGGAIYANTAATINYSTFVANTSTNGRGGAIFDASTVTANNITLANNTAPNGDGAGIYNASTLAINNSIVTGGRSRGAAGIDTVLTALTEGSNIDYYNNIETSTLLEDDCYRCTLNAPDGSAGAITGANLNPYLTAALATNSSALTPVSTSPITAFSTTPLIATASQTLIPLPGSAAICAGSAVTHGLDQRGLNNYNTTYTGSDCYDLGAVQTNYSLAESVNPTYQPSNVTLGADMAPVEVILSEGAGTGAPFYGGSATVDMTDAPDNDLTTSPATEPTTALQGPMAGIATFSTLAFTNTETGDSLTATVALNPNITSPALVLTVALTPTFNVGQPLLTVTMPPGTQTFGPAIGATYLATATATGFVGGNPTYNLNADGTWSYTSSPNPTCFTPAPTLCGSSAVTAGSFFSVGTYTITATFTPTVSPYNTEFAPASSTQVSNYVVTQETPADPFIPSPTSQTYSAPIQIGTLDATFSATIAGNPTVLNGPGYIGPACGTPSPNCSEYGTVTYTATSAGGTVTTPLTPGPGGTVLPTGSYTLTATFTPNATWSPDLTTQTATAQYQVTQATPTFNPATWAPGTTTQSYGMPIAANVLNEAVTNATANATTTSIPGTFNYTTTISGVPNLPITAGPNGTVLPVGSYTLTVTFIPNDTLDFATVSTTYSSYTVTQATPVVSFAPVPTTQVYGTNVVPGVLDATASYAINPASPGNTLPVAGTFAYTYTLGNTGSCTTGAALTTSTLPLAVGSYTIMACFTPNDATDYTIAQSSTSGPNYVVTAQTPTLSLLPASQYYGPTVTAANSTYLNASGANPANAFATATATINGVASVLPGTWSFSATGCSATVNPLLSTTQLNACVYNVTATFTPVGGTGQLLPANFAGSTTVTSTYTVNQTTPTLNFTGSPLTTIYHQAIAAGSLAVSATNPATSTTISGGTYAYTTTVSTVPNQVVTAGETTLPVNTYLITITYTPPSANYTTATTSFTYTVTQQTPVPTSATFAPSPSSQSYGSPIAAGTFTFAAKDSVNSVNVPGNTYYTAVVNGVTTTLTQGVGGTILPAGSYTITANFTPTDTLDYASITQASTSQYTVNAVATTTAFTPPITSQVFGTTILPAFFNAAASYAVPPGGNGNTAAAAGTFTYYLGTSCSGTQVSTSSVLAASATAYSITACFSPTDTTDFQSSFATASYTVTPLAPTLSLAPASQSYGPTVLVANPTYLNASGAVTPNAFASATAVINGVTTVVPGTWSFSLTGCSTTVNPLLAASQLGACVYAATATFTPNGASGNTIASNFVSGGLAASTYSVNQTTPTLSFTGSPLTTIFHQAIAAGSLAVSATNPVTSTTISGGTYAYTTTVSTVPNQVVTAGETTLPVDTYLITITYTPPSANYTTATTSFTYTVTQQTPVPTSATFAPSPSSQSYGSPIAAGTFTFAAKDSVNSVNVPGNTYYTAVVNGVTTTLTQGVGGTILPAGSYTITANFTPTDTLDYASITQASTSQYTVNAVATTTTFVPPLSTQTQVYGTTIPPAFFDATAAYTVPPSGNGNLATPAGSFTYYLGTSCSGTTINTSSTPLAVGPHSITACFNPTDTTDFATSFATGTLTVTQATPTVSLLAGSQNYGPAILASYLAGATATAVVNGTSTNLTANGTWAYTSVPAPAGGNPITPGTTVLTAGLYTITATFTPTGATATNFTTASTTAVYKVNVVTPTLSYSPSPITTGYSATIPTPAGVFDALALNANVGNPNGSPATNPIPGTWTYTTTINNSTNASVIGTSVNGATSGTSSGTILPAASYLVVATFTPTDTTDYVSAGFVTAVYTVTADSPTGNNFIPVPTTQIYGPPIAASSLDANFFYPAGTNINAAGTITYTAELVGGGPIIPLTAGLTVLPVGTYTLTATFTPNTSSYNIATINSSTSYVVTQATPQLVFANGSQVFGTPISGGPGGFLNVAATSNSVTGLVVPGTTVYTTTIAGTGTGTGTQTLSAGVTILPVATYTVTATFTPNDTADYASPQTKTATYTVSVAAPVISLSSSANPIFSTNAVTFTALVSLNPQNPAPENVLQFLNGGTVTFENGSTPIGTGTIVNGVATLTLTAAQAATLLPDGANTITAVYTASTNFATATSAPLTETVTDFNFTLTVNSVTVQPGGEAVVDFTVTPLNSTSFPTTVTLSLNGLPSGASYSFTPASVLAGTAAQQVVLTINVPPPSTVVKAEPGNDFSGKLPLTLALLLLPFAGSLRKNSKRLGRMLSIVLLVVAGLTAAVGLSGCGASVGGYFGQQPQNYTLTLTGTSGTLSHSATITLSVE